LGSGDSALYLNALPESLSQFEALRDEIQWNEMHHKGGTVPRLVAIQGSIGSTVPVYRHPVDYQPDVTSWTPLVAAVKDAVQEKIGQSMNHCLIQLYRTGHDFIGEHADKSLDIQRSSYVVNYSVGCSRVLILKSKPNALGPKIVQKITMPHNSIFLLGWNTNVLFKHEIKQDKRLPMDKREDELAYDAQRISFTFRNVSTFLDTASNRLFGQGAKNKTLKVDQCIGDEGAGADATRATEIDRLMMAFSDENRRADFDWDAAYGEGFDVINF
ncbi:unnamed protein product, partial [Ectocarpus fasciculatus]